MKLKEKISFEDFEGKKFKVRIVEEASNQKAAFTHYLHNHINGVSATFKKDA